MTEIPNNKQYDLEKRTLAFAKRVSKYVNELPKTLPNVVNGKQLIRASGSVGANYIEANESLSKKDFLMRIKISRKEAKEACCWLDLSEPREDYEQEKTDLINEATELKKILCSIVEKSK